VLGKTQGALQEPPDGIQVPSPAQAQDRAGSAEGASRGSRQGVPGREEQMKLIPDKITIAVMIIVVAAIVAYWVHYFR
jgi:hypothetical protein